MNLKSICILIIAIGLVSCKRNAPPKRAITKDTITYNYQTINKREPSCDKPDSDDCTYIKIQYPVFKQQPALNNSIVNALLSNFSTDDKSDITLSLLAKDYLIDQKPTPNHPHYIRWSLDLNADVTPQNPGIISVEIKGVFSEAGKSGLNTTTATYFVNWDTEKHRPITLTDIFIDHYSDKLAKIAEQVFRTEEKLSDTASLKTDDYRFDDGKFRLNNNFLITQEGIKFLFNKGDIQPNGYGQTVFIIPYKLIKHLLRSNTVVSQYIK